MSLDPVAVLYQGDWAPSSQAASLLDSHAVPLEALQIIEVQYMWKLKPKEDGSWGLVANTTLYQS